MMVPLELRDILLGFKPWKAVALAAAVLAVATGWWGVTEALGRRAGREAGAGPIQAGAPPTESRHLLPPGLLEQTGGTTIPSNLFHSPVIDQHLALRAAQRTRGEAEKARREAEAAARAPATPAARPAAPDAGGGGAPKPAPPAPVMIEVGFQGVVRTADGQVVGLVTVTPPGLVMTCAAGEPCLGAVVEAVSRDALRLRLGDGKECTVASGASVRIEEDRLRVR